MTQAIQFKQVKALPVYKQTAKQYWADKTAFYPFLYAVAKQQKDAKAMELLRSYMKQKGIKVGRKTVSTWLETDLVGQRKKPKASKRKSVKRKSTAKQYRNSKASSSAKQKLVYKAIEALTELAELV